MESSTPRMTPTAAQGIHTQQKIGDLEYIKLDPQPKTQTISKENRYKNSQKQQVLYYKGVQCFL